MLAQRDQKLLGDAGATAVELTFFDDACSAEGGARVARQISTLEAKPIAVLGHACPSAAQSAAPIYSAANLTFMSAGFLPARQTMMRRFGPMQFSLPGDGSQATAIASMLADSGATRIAIVRDRTLYAIEATQAISAALGAAARNIVIQEIFAGGDKDFAGLAQRMKTANVSHVVLSAFPSEGGLLIAELRKANPTVVILATDQLADPGFPRSFPDAAEGVLVPLPADYHLLRSAANVVQQIQPSNAASARVALATYAALECLLAAIRDQQPLSTAGVAQALSGRQFDTILGTIRFDAAGAASLPRFGLFTWHGGQLVWAGQDREVVPGVASRMRLP